MRCGLLLVACARCVVLAVLAGCAGAEAMTLPAAPAAKPSATGEVGLVPGETMAFEVKLAGIVAGEAQLAVGQIGDFEGRRALVVKSRAATAGAAALVKHIVDEATTVIDLASGRPISLETVVELGDARTTASAKFTDTAAEITYSRSEDQTPRQMRIAFGATPLHDAHTAMAQVRGWRPAPGATRSVFVVGGRRLWRVDVTYAGDEMIGSTLGNRRAIKFTGAGYRANRSLAIEPGRAARTFTVWLTDDADRVPLRVLAKTELGEVAIELTEYSREPAAR